MKEVPSQPSPIAPPDPRAASWFRRFGYAALPGDAFSYVLHLRPAEWPIMAAHTALGFFLATRFRPDSAGSSWTEFVVVLFTWVVCLNGGTLAVNSAFDRDEGDIGYLRAPPAPPLRLAAFSIALMTVGQVLALLIGAGFAVVYAVCFALSILYSVPPYRFKAVAGVDWVINMVGFGTLTPLAGWLATARPLEWWAGLVLLAFCPLFAALYPLTQLYQFEEDRARGDRTLALVLGMRRSLGIALGSAALAFILFGAALIAGEPNRWAPLFLVAAGAWAWVLVPWYRHHASMTPAAHQKGMYAALRAWAVTDVVVLLVWAV